MIQPLLLILRPEPGASATQAAAAALGLIAERFALFHAAPCAWEAPSPDSFDAILLGSANALRHGGAALAAYAGKPAYCVGEATALAARAMGMSLAATGQGGLQPMLGALNPAHKRLLRLAGQSRVDLSPPPGITMVERICYNSAPQPLPHALGRLLTTYALPGFIALLHSGEAARHFAAEMTRLSLPLSRIHAIAIGPRVAEIAAQTPGWASLSTAPQPTDAAMLALAQQMCQTFGHD
jgi:uroporphyrinogen-III synthase